MKLANSVSVPLPRMIAPAARSLRATVASLSGFEPPSATEVQLKIYEHAVQLFSQRKLAEARVEFETALRLNPDNFKAHGNLGVICAEQGEAALAETHFRSALRINPDDSLAQGCLNELLKAKANRKTRN